MRDDVRLKDVTEDNWRDVIALRLDAGQEDLVASNLYSIAESKFDPDARPRAVYAGKRVVGFLMYESLESDGRLHDYSIYRLMIDKRQQGKGYGRAALELAIDEMRQDRHVNRITISYVPGNPVSKRFYGSLGFEEVGLDEDGEMIAELAISKK